MVVDDDGAHVVLFDDVYCGGIVFVAVVLLSVIIVVVYADLMLLALGLMICSC